VHRRSLINAPHACGESSVTGTGEESPSTRIGECHGRTGRSRQAPDCGRPYRGTVFDLQQIEHQLILHYINPPQPRQVSPLLRTCRHQLTHVRFRSSVKPQGRLTGICCGQGTCVVIVERVLGVRQADSPSSACIKDGHGTFRAVMPLFDPGQNRRICCRLAQAFSVAHQGLRLGSCHYAEPSWIGLTINRRLPGRRETWPGQFQPLSRSTP